MLESLILKIARLVFPGRRGPVATNRRQAINSKSSHHDSSKMIDDLHIDLWNYDYLHHKV